MIDINSSSVAECGFPEQYLFWLLMCCGIAAALMSFAIAEHAKEKYKGIAFLSVFLALFSDKYF